MPQNDRLVVTPLGGLGEIGLNCMSWSYGEDMVLVDSGLMFPEDYHQGVDVVIPRFDHLVENKDRLRGILLTHGHEDHIGALPWLVPQLGRATIYGSPFTLALVEHKLGERDLLDRVKLVRVGPEKQLELGSFAFTFFPVSHSIIDGLALGAQTPVGRIIHTGDFKLDPDPLEGPGTDLEAFRRFAGPEGVRLLLSDSTNIESPGHTPNERHVFASLGKIFRQLSGRILITLFSSNIQRIQEVFDCAEASGRKVVVAGRSLLNNIEMARNLGRLRVRDNTYYEFQSFQPDSLPDHQTVLLVTGSQGEPMSALARMAWGGMKNFSIRPGDTVIMSSRLIPGNTGAVNRMINQLYRQGAEVLYQKSGIHASGHAYRDELTDMLKAVRPEYFIPVHGEYRHLVKHAALAVEQGVDPDKAIVLENGFPVSFGSGDFKREAPIPADSILVDGKGVGDVGHVLLKERQVLGDEGVVIVLLVLDELTGQVLLGPEVLSKGFVFKQQYSHLLEDSKCIVLDVLEDDFVLNEEKLGEKIRIAMRRFFRGVLERDPVVVPVVRML